MSMQAFVSVSRFSWLKELWIQSLHPDGGFGAEILMSKLWHPTIIATCMVPHPPPPPSCFTHPLSTTDDSVDPMTAWSVHSLAVARTPWPTVLLSQRDHLI